MALVNTLRDDATPGEKRFVRLISFIDKEYSELELRLYAEPNGPEVSPDFVLYSAMHGIKLFEIKDFSADKIKSFDLHELEHWGYNDKLKTLSFTRKETFEYITEFEEVGVSIPVEKLYVFPNLTMKEAREIANINFQHPGKVKGSQEKKVMSKFIFADDFEDVDLFLEKVSSIMTFDYHETPRLQEVALSKITRNLPNPVMEKGQDGALQTSLFTTDTKENEIFVLSRKQERVLTKWMNKGGYRFIKGHAGTGKTVLLISRAQYLAERIPNVKILITYISSSLDGVFRHLMEKYPDQIKAQRLVQFCYHKINNEVHDDNDWPKYIEESLVKLSDPDHPLRGYYDFIMVDEGQDFTSDMGDIVEILAKGVNHKEKKVLVAFDNNQAISNKHQADTLETFKGKQVGRVKILEDSFRVPEEIACLAARLIDEPVESVRSVKDAFLHRRIKEGEALFAKVAAYVNQIKNNPENDFDFRDIAIIYPHSGHFHKRIEKEVREHINVPYQMHKRKKVVDPASNTVKILSSTYAKGLDFKVVFLVYFDELESSNYETLTAKAKETLYVSMTRALYHVILMTKKTTPLLDIILKEETKEEFLIEQD